MIDATKAVEAALRVYERLVAPSDSNRPKNYSARQWMDEALLVLEFCRQVERERRATPEKLKKLRDEIAMHALEGMLASHDRGGQGRLWQEDGYAEDAYAFADEMLAAREKKE